MNLKNQRITAKILLKEGLKTSYQKIFNGVLPRLEKQIHKSLTISIVSAIFSLFLLINKVRPEIITACAIFMVCCCVYFCFKVYKQSLLIDLKLEESDIISILNEENNNVDLSIKDSSFSIELLKKYIKEESSKLENENDVDSLSYLETLNYLEECRYDMRIEKRRLGILEKKKGLIIKELQFFK